jgi:PAS domain S-box-containing protein
MNPYKTQLEVLLIEDEAAHAELVRRAFVRTGDDFNLSLCKNLKEAHEYLARKQPDLIITDLNLPDGNSIGFLKSNHFKIPVIVMTGFGNEADAVAAIKAGAMDYVVKSDITLSDIPHVTRRILREWQLSRSHALSESENLKLSQAIEQSPAAMIITDLNGNIEYANLRFQKLTGYSSEELMGQNPRILKSGHTPPKEYALMWNQLKAGRSYSGVFKNQRKDQSFYWASIIVSTIIDKEGNTTHFLGTQEDITQAIQEKEARVDLEKQLRKSQKMETIGTLAGGIAHDFNNILTPIFGFASLAKQDLDKASYTYHCLDHILKSAERARDLVQQILLFSRQGEESLEVVDVGEVLQETLTLLRASLPSTIQIESKIAPNLPKIRANPTQIHQILMNLSTNSAHAMRDHGGLLCLEVLSESVDSATRRTNPALTEPSLAIIISDTGEGIAPELKDRIFEPFFTTKAVGEGTGLGLSVVHGITTNMGGDIKVSSIPNSGTQVKILLPILNQDTVISEVNETLFQASGEHIVVIDDEPEIVLVYQKLLSKAGFQVECFLNSQEALDYIQETSENIRVVITDLTMPQPDGLKLAQAIKHCKPEIPIILTSGYSAEHSEADLQAKGLFSCLNKPVPLHLLIREIGKAMQSKTL